MWHVEALWGIEVDSGRDHCVCGGRDSDNTHITSGLRGLFEAWEERGSENEGAEVTKSINCQGCERDGESARLTWC